MLIQKHKSLQWLLYVSITVIFYLPAYRYGMVTDFLSWIYKYQNGNFFDSIHSFGYKGLHPVFHFINFSFYKIFGLNKLMWCIFFAILHGSNAYLMRAVLQNWLSNWQVKNTDAIATIASIFFLISPYQVEVLTWNACMHYLLFVMFFLIAFHYLLQHFKQPNNLKPIFLHHLFFILGLFTLELALAAPFIYACYFVFHRRIAIVHSIRHLKLFSLPQLVFLVLYFVLNKVSFGDWVGHYGSEHHFGINISGIFQNAINYFNKYALLTHFWSYNWRDWIYTISSNLITINFFIAGSLFLFFRIWFKFSENKSLQFSATQLLMFFMALVPIITLYFMYLVPYQNDRYGYFASIFFYSFLVGLVFNLSQFWRSMIIMPMVILHLLLAYQMILNCRTAGKILDGLVDTFEYCEDAEIILLGLPDNYRGMYLYRDLNNDNAITFTESMDLFSGVECKDVHIIDVAQFNSVKLADRIKPQRIDSVTIRLDFGQYGTWWWKDGIGFTPFENEKIKVEIDQASIIFTDKLPQQEKSFIYPIGPRWFEFKN